MRPVELAGRGARFGEAPATTVQEIVSEVLRDVVSKLDCPICLFGHSMGATIAFELARAMVTGGFAPPLHLFVSARIAPQEPCEPLALADASDEAVTEVLHRLGGTSPELLADPGFLEFFLPVARADFGLVNGYVYQPSSPLQIPITAISGSADMTAPEPKMLSWRRETSMSFRHHVVGGEHFYIDHNPAKLLDIVGRMGASLNLSLEARLRRQG